MSVRGAGSGGRAQSEDQAAAGLLNGGIRTTLSSYRLAAAATAEYTQGLRRRHIGGALTSLLRR